jgi:hypothetical protein
VSLAKSAFRREGRKALSSTGAAKTRRRDFGIDLQEVAAAGSRAVMKGSSRRSRVDGERVWHTLERSATRSSTKKPWSRPPSDVVFLNFHATAQNCMLEADNNDTDTIPRTYTQGYQNADDAQEFLEAQHEMQDGAVDVVESGERPEGADMPEQANEERVTTPYMTKYERARILGTRALQIS